MPTEPLVDSRPHVVHLVSGDQWAGEEVMTLNLLTALEAAGRWRASAICLNDGTLAARLRHAGLDVQVFDERTLSFGSIVRQARASLSGRDVRVLHSHRYKEHLLGAILAPRLGARLLATVHGLPEKARGRRLRYALQHRAAFWLLRWRFDLVVAVSKALERELTDVRGIPRRQVLSVSNGIPAPETSGAIRPHRPLHVGSVGRLVPVKGFDLFVRLAAQLRSREVPVRFSILGDGPDRAALQAQVTSAGLDDVFSLAPPTPDPWPFYQSLDLYVSTSEAEGLPLSILEAMAAGLAVVAPAVGGIPEVIEHGRSGWLVGTREVQDYAAACGTLLLDTEARAAMGAEAKSRVLREFSARRMAADYAAAYERLCPVTSGLAATA